jgi:hypothetical protein
MINWSCCFFGFVVTQYMMGGEGGMVEQAVHLIGRKGEGEGEEGGGEIPEPCLKAHTVTQRPPNSAKLGTHGPLGDTQDPKHSKPEES